MADAGPLGHDSAVILGCDANYLPFALFLCRQVTFHCPDRHFDLMIVSDSDMPLPGWAVAAGIRVVVLPADASWSAIPAGGFGPASFLPLRAIGRLASDYRRVLALDSDMWFEGGDLDRLLHLDLGPHPVAAVRDVPFLHGRDEHAAEFRALGLPLLPYLNSGVVLYDTAAFVAQDFEARFLTIGATHALPYADQSLLNIALRGRYAELAPAWNWMSNYELALATRRYPAHFRHFIGPVKPWADVWGLLDARFAAGYGEFFRQCLPEALDRLKPRNQAQLDLREVGQIALDYLKARKRVVATLSKFPDDWTVRG